MNVRVNISGAMNSYEDETQTGMDSGGSKNYTCFSTIFLNFGEGILIILIYYTVLILLSNL